MPSNCYPEPLQSAKVWSNLFFQRKKATTRNNSVFPGLGKNTTGAPQLHFLKKYASCLILPKKLQNSRCDGWPKVCTERIQHKPHRNWQEVGLALAHAQSRRLESWTSDNQISSSFSGRRAIFPSHVSGKRHTKLCRAYLYPVALALLPLFSSPVLGIHLRSHKTTWPKATFAGPQLHALSREPLYNTCESQTMMMVKKKN